jgi:hypothetical protein
MTRPPVHLQSLKLIFERHGVAWRNTSILIGDLGSKAHLYSLARAGLLEHQMYSSWLKKKFGIRASGPELISGFWRITPRGLDVLESTFQINTHDAYVSYATALLLDSSSR